MVGSEVGLEIRAIYSRRMNEEPSPIKKKRSAPEWAKLARGSIKRVRTEDFTAPTEDTPILPPASNPISPPPAVPPAEDPNPINQEQWRQELIRALTSGGQIPTHLLQHLINK